MEALDEYLTAKEIMASTKFSKDKAYEIIYSLNYVRSGRNIRVRRSDFEAWWQKQIDSSREQTEVMRKKALEAKVTDMRRREFEKRRKERLKAQRAQEARSKPYGT